jgi:aryl-alcohol dehydrogenase-like predicted oxidoreductase
MEYTTFGRTGIEVSRLCLGCMSFGTSSWRDWVLDEDAGKELVDRAIELGINVFDTANWYSRGESERVLGEALDGRREENVVATKAFMPYDESNRHSGGLSRKTIHQELDSSLDRLSMDAVDLYQIHRWDDDTPIEQTLRALDDAVSAGKTYHVGASSMWTYQFASALHASERLDLDRFVSMQNHYNLVYREEEREMLPFCSTEDVAVMPWSPVARGYLARPDDAIDATTRGQAEEHLFELPYRDGGGKEINARVEQIAEEKGVKMAQIALSWLLHKEWVDTPVVGTTSVEHLEDAVEALDVSLSDSDLAWLEEPYEPVRVAGHD